MANRYAEDIRRIAGTDDLSSTPEKNPEKDPIRGRRGIAYVKADGSIGGASGESGETIPPSDAIGGENAPAKEGGSYGSNTSGSGVTVENEGGTTSDQPGDNNLGIIPAESLADGTAGVGDSFAGVELYDCGSGQEYTVRSDGQFTPPDGWDTAESPPISPEYQEGFYWVTPAYAPLGNPDVFGSTPGEVFAQLPGVYTVASADYTKAGYSAADSGPTTIYIVEYSRESAPSIYPVGINRGSCSGVTEPYCTNPDPTGGVTSWPVDSPAQLSWDPEQAAFLTSSFDTNVDQKYKDNNVGELNLCDFSGNPVQVQAGKDGGLVYTFSGGIVIVKDASNKIVAGVSLSNKDQYLAKQT